MTAPSPLFIQAMQDGVNRVLIDAVSYIVGAGVSGDLAEFGTMSGATSHILAQFLAQTEQHWHVAESAHQTSGRKLHLFDSFIGLPDVDSEHDKNSPHYQAQVWKKGVCKDLNAIELRQLIEQSLPAQRVLIYEGWFSDTLTLINAETKFALLHIDCDFYESTYQVLDYIFARKMLADGCMILFDDWNCNRASPKFGERKAWLDILQKYPEIRYSDEGAYSVFGHKFIVHTEV